jgi:histone-lysine N-methyltransferase SETMAR
MLTKMENQQFVSSSRQRSSTPVGFGQEFLSKEQCDKLEHPPYSPDIATGDSCLFPRLKSALKGRRFCYATVIIKNAMEEMKMLSQYGFQECFYHLYSRWQICGPTVVLGGYYEISVA